MPRPTEPNRTSLITHPLVEGFPDIREMRISKRLAEWGVDVGEMEVIFTSEPREVAAADPATGLMHINRKMMEEFFPGDAAYITLAHELAHFLQFVEDRVDWEQSRKWRTIHQWISQEHETDALRWSARQAIDMGMTEREWERYSRRALGEGQAENVHRIGHPVFAGTWPEERGVRPVFMGGRPFVAHVARKIRVRKHVRRGRQAKL